MVTLMLAKLRALPEAEAALASDQSGFAADWFLGVHNPPLRMAIVGAVHIAQALAPMARLAGFDVTLIDVVPQSALEGMGMPGAGASSITFWWRRCSEQSRS